MNELIQIKDVALKYGISKKTIRYYEEIGILRSVRKGEAGYRYYDSDSLKRLEQILLLRRLNFSIHETSLILGSDHKQEDVKKIFREKLNFLQKELDALASLKNVIRTITELIECKGAGELNIYQIVREQLYIHEKVERMIHMDTYAGDIIKIEFGVNVVPHANELVTRIKELRKELEGMYHQEIPLIRVMDNFGLKENQLRILYKGEVMYNECIGDSAADDLFKTVQCLKEVVEKYMGEKVG